MKVNHQPPAAIVLAAGLGQRLGGVPKAALRHPDGTSLLARSAHALRASGVSQISVVLGPYLEVLLPLATACAVRPLIHTLPHPSLIDSQRLALTDHATHQPQTDALLLLSDLPGLTAAHLAPVLAAWQSRAERGDEGIHALMPVVNGQRGHPVLLSAQAVQAIVQQPADLGVRAWLAAHPQAVQTLALDDAAYVSDADTPEDAGRFGLKF